MVGVSPAVAAAKTVTNVATFSFQTGPSAPAQSVSSNSLSLSYPDRAPASTPSTVELLRLSSGNAGGSAVAADGAQCQNTAGSFAPAPLPTQNGKAIDPGAVVLQKTGSFHAGDPLFIRLTDGNRNLDSTVREFVDVRVTSSAGDEEVVRLQETGPDTGVFAGALQSVSDAAPAIRFDCRLTVGSNATISVRYVDAIYPTDTSQSSALVDPFGTVFDSTTGQPVNGATITIVNLSTGQPATVFGDDGVSAYPATVTSGAQVSDASGRIYTVPTGGFRFPLLITGDYVLRIVAPAGYTSPSAVPAATLIALTAANGQTFAIGPGSFGDRFTIPQGNPFKVDVPIDPVSANVVIQKLASVAIASTGDFVQYQIVAQNRSATSAAPRVVILDSLPAGLRYKAGSLRIGGKKIADPVVARDGRTLTISVGDLPANSQISLTYVVQVITGAPLGDAVNSASASAAGVAASNVASAAIKIRAPLFSDRFTIIGRVIEGACTDGAYSRGVPNARVLLDDGNYVVSDKDGMFHFEGVRPGTHVVQLDVDTLPSVENAQLEANPCIQNTRFAGRSFSQFVEGQGGSLMRADFYVRKKASGSNASNAVPDAATTPASTSLSTANAKASDAVEAIDATRERRAIADEVTAAGGNERWLEGRTRGIEWIFPKPDHNPRAPAIRIAIKHDASQTVHLSNAGRPVSALAFDGTEVSADKSYAVSVWRGLPLTDGDNSFEADLVAADGAVVAHLARVVHYANAPARAEFVAAQSVLVADGIHKPVLAVRLVDRNGRPVRAGLIGPYRVNAPYTPALEVELQQSRQLAGLDRNPTQYKVEGDDGIAYIELAPTTETGSVILQFDFDRALSTAPSSSLSSAQSGSHARSQELRAWLVSTQRDWIVVGFAKGTVGYDKLKLHMETLPEDKGADGPGDRARLDASGQASLYAKGRILGDWLLTLAYDSAKPTAERQRDSLLGVINPRQFYTLYGDGSQQRPDAASASKLYLKLERDQFYALFGDFETGLTQSKLARYSRTLNGIKTEYRGNGISFIGFASDTAQGYGRDEILGNGTSGLYRLSQSNILINSERIHIETRSRFRSDVIVESRALARTIDYDIDYAAGTLFFREPIQSRDPNFNPVFVIAEYETEGVGNKKLSAGGRAAVELLDGRAALGVSAIRDASNANTSDLVGIDAKFKLRPDTELRVEAARSRSAQPLSAYTRDASGGAQLVEVEHNDEKFNAIAYLRRQDAGFGVNQQNAVESGTSKAGIDAQYLLAPQTTLIGQAYHLTNLINHAQRDAANAQIEYKALPWTLRVGGILANDTSSTGAKLESRQATVGVSRTFLDNRLELSAEANVSVGGKNESSDYPSRYVLGAAYALTERWKIIAAEEYAVASSFHALTTRVGFQADPWVGAKLTSTLNQSAISEYGPRTFGVLGLKQSVPIDDRWSVDFSADNSRTFHGNGTAASTTGGALVAPGSIGSSTLSSLSSYGVSSNSPTALGGSGTFANSTGSAATISALAENFTAFSAGATYREALWTWAGRIESRNGQLADRHGLTTAFLRQADAGIAFAAAAQVFSVSQANGVRGLLARGDLSWAWRPLGGRWSVLDKLELKRDALHNGSGAYDGALFGSTSLQGAGNAHSTRLINNFALNGVGKPWSVRDTEGDLFELKQRSQWALYYGSKYVFDRFDDADYRGYTDLIGIEGRLDVTREIDVGFRVNRLHAWSSHTTSYSAGPSVGFTPFANAWVSVGYNIRGFRDRDFAATNYTARGPYVTMRFKFDQLTGRESNASASRAAGPAS